jgi:hypothetical protein
LRSNEELHSAVSMKVGDLVVQKYDALWRTPDDEDYLMGRLMLVLSVSQGAVRLIDPSGKIKCSLADRWEVVSECG